MNEKSTISRPQRQSRLLGAVISQALADLKNEDDTLRDDAIHFFQSDWYRIICDYFEVPECRRAHETAASLVPSA